LSDDRRAIDVARDHDVLPHTSLWVHTTARLMARSWWRPAGSSAKLWKKLGGNDPFLPPKPERKMLEEHRQVSAAGRFVRIDKHEKKKNPGLPGPKKQERQENVPDWVVKLREQAQGRAAQGKKPLQVHTPAAIAKAPTVRPASKRNPERPPPQAPPTSAPKRASKSGRLLPQRPRHSSTHTGAPGRPPLLRNHQPDTAAAKPFADVDALTDRRPPLIRPDSSAGRGGPIKRGLAPPGGAPPLIRPGEGRAKQQRGRPQSSRPKTDRPKTPPGGAPPLVRDFQPQTGLVDPFSQRFGAADAKPRQAQRLRRDAPPPGGAPPMIRDGKQVNTPGTITPTHDSKPSPPSATSDDPFDGLLGNSTGRTRRTGRAKPEAGEPDAPRRRRPVIGGPPPGGSVPLNRQAAPVSSPTMAGKQAPTPLNSPGRPTEPKKAAPSAPTKRSSDPFDGLMGSSEGGGRLKAPKKAEAPKRRRPVIGGPPPGGSVPLNRDAAPVSSTTMAGKAPPPPRNSPGRPADAPKKPPVSTKPSARVKPTAPEPPTPKKSTKPKKSTPPKKSTQPKTPVKPPSSGGGGMDDLFGGGPQEGRVRLGRAKKPKAGEDSD
jgi:hypothetical protein